MIELTSGVRVDSGASWYWGGLTRKPIKQPPTTSMRIYEYDHYVPGTSILPLGMTSMNLND